MANLSIQLAFILLTFIPLLKSGLAAPPETEVSRNFQEQGFKNIGSIIHETSTDGEEEEKRMISLWMSPKNNKETQAAAMIQCRQLHGELLYILSDAQFQEAQMIIMDQGAGETFWTAGVYDESQKGFAWFGHNFPVSKKYFRTRLVAAEARTCSTAGSGLGLTIQGAMVSFGLCGAKSDMPQRYICRV